MLPGPRPQGGAGRWPQGKVAPKQVYQLSPSQDQEALWTPRRDSNTGASSLVTLVTTIKGSSTEAERHDLPNCSHPSECKSGAEQAILDG